MKKGDKVDMNQEGLEVKPLDKFENSIVDVALQLLDEKIDPETAAMDILDAINDKKMTEDIQYRAGIQAQGTDPLVTIHRILSERLNAKTTDSVMRRVMGEVYPVLSLLEEEQDDDDGDDRDYYGTRTDTEGQEKDWQSDSKNCKADLADIHSEMLTCWADLRKAMMDCARDDREVPDTLRTTIDKLGRNIEKIESLAERL